MTQVTANDTEKLFEKYKENSSSGATRDASLEDSLVYAAALQTFEDYKSGGSGDTLLKQLASSEDSKFDILKRKIASKADLFIGREQTAIKIEETQKFDAEAVKELNSLYKEYQKGGIDNKNALMKSMMEHRGSAGATAQFIKQNNIYVTDPELHAHYVRAHQLEKLPAIKTLDSVYEGQGITGDQSPKREGGIAG